jgi:3-isopropylmalate/(R)-2-methylmalate dehydratase large subunit
MTAPKTLYDKIWDAHLVDQAEDGTALIYIDRHLVHEVTSPQAFEGLRLTGRKVRCPEKTIAVPDHNVPTTEGREKGIENAESRIQVDELDRNAREFGIHYYPVSDVRQGIVHIIGPEQGWTLPGMTIVCGDSHTATHGAFGALAFGIGTSEVEHVLATQTLIAKKSKNMRVEITGTAAALRHRQGHHAVGHRRHRHRRRHRPRHRVLRRGDPRPVDGRPHDGLQHGHRGRRARWPDRARRKDLRVREGPPARAEGRGVGSGDELVEDLRSDEGAHWDKVVTIRAEDIAPVVTWGTSPRTCCRSPPRCRLPESFAGGKVGAAKRSLDYMGLKPGQKLTDVAIDAVFIGSCTNGRIEDLRAAADVLRGRKLAPGVRGMVVPGSGLVRAQAEEEGLAQVFIDAGFEWRLAGCSMCLGMNPDQLAPGERCAATSNRNFEGRMGRGGRTHLMSPVMAAAAAVTGRLTDVRELMAETV